MRGFRLSTQWVESRSPIGFSCILIIGIIFLRRWFFAHRSTLLLNSPVPQLGFARPWVASGTRAGFSRDSDLNIMVFGSIL